MKRMFYIDCYYGGTEKYKFQKEYEGFGIYQRMTPSGYYSHQDYLITNGDMIVVSQSYNAWYDRQLQWNKEVWSQGN